jgi:hypothetical protein
MNVKISLTREHLYSVSGIFIERCFQYLRLHSVEREDEDDSEQWIGKDVEGKGRGLI